jgi:hypothetical protein
MKFNELSNMMQKPEPKPDTYEAGMALNQLLKIGTHAIKIHNMIDDDAEMEAWVAKKIDLASNYVKSVHGYTAGSKAGTYDDGGMSEMKRMPKGTGTMQGVKEDAYAKYFDYENNDEYADNVEKYGDVDKTPLTPQERQQFKKWLIDTANDYSSMALDGVEEIGDDPSDIEDQYHKFIPKIKEYLKKAHATQNIEDFASDVLGVEEKFGDEDMLDNDEGYRVAKDHAQHAMNYESGLSKLKSKGSDFTVKTIRGVLDLIDDDPHIASAMLVFQQDFEGTPLQRKVSRVQASESVSEDAGNIDALKKWLIKYSKYRGMNGDKLPFGLYMQMAQTGVPTDGMEAGEAKQAIADQNPKLDPTDADAMAGAAEEIPGVDFDKADAPITNAMKSELADIMGVDAIGEGEITKAMKMLGLVKESVSEDAGEGHMSKSQLYQTAKMAIELLDMINKGDDLEGWVQTKLNLAADYLQAVYHYEDYQKLNPYREELDGSLMQRHAGIIQKHLDEILERKCRAEDVDTKPGMMRILKKRVNEVEKEIAKENRKESQETTEAVELEEGIREWGKRLAMAGVIVAGLAGVNSINNAIDNSIPAVKAMNTALEMAQDSGNDELAKMIEKDLSDAKIRLTSGKDLTHVADLQDKYAKFMKTEGLTYESKLAVNLKQRLK